jgi:hypothetical protein
MKILFILIALAGLPHASASAESFTSKRSVFPASRAAGITFALIGTGTAWSGSPFTVVNSVTGTTTAVVAAQNIISATTATIRITTGAGIGTFNISDGVATYALTTQLVTLEQGQATFNPDAITIALVRSDTGAQVSIPAPPGSTMAQIDALILGVSASINQEAAENTHLTGTAF